MAGKAGSIKAGEAYVELLSKDGKLVKGLQATAAKVKAWGQGIQAAGKAMLATGLLIQAPFIAAVKHFVDAGSAMNDMSARTGTSVEALSEFQYAAEQTGASIGDVETGIRKMSKTIGDAQGGSAQANASLAKLGLTVGELKGLSPDEQFRTIAASIVAIEDPAERTAAAMRVFGKSGTMLLPMIGDLGALTSRARELGLVMSGTDAAAADTLGDLLGDLWAVLKMVTFQVGAALAPELTALVSWLAQTGRGVIDFVTANKGLIVTVFKVGAALAAGGAALVVAGTLVAYFGTAIASLGTALVTVASVLGAVLSPVGLVVVAFGAAAAAAIYFSGAGSAAMRFVAGEFAYLGTIATETFGGIATALSQGDIKGAMDVLVTGLRIAWLETLNKLNNDYTGWMSWLFDQWKNIRIAFIDVTVALSNLWDDCLAVMMSAWKQFGSGVGGWMQSMLKSAGMTTAANMVGVANAVLSASSTGFDPEARKADRQQKADKSKAEIGKETFLGWAGGIRDGLNSEKQRMKKLKEDQAMRLWEQAEWGGSGKARKPTGLTNMPEQLASKSISAIGSFNASRIGSMGPDSLAKEQLKVLKQIADNTDPDNADNEGMRVGE
jgi:hypothetical protein